MSGEKKMTDDEELIQRRRKRSIALALVLGALVILFYAITFAKTGSAILQRPL